MSTPDSFELSRFIDAQDPMFDGVLAELRGGRKQSHWMWFIFPQIDGLGFSRTTRHFAIKSAPEARAYLAHPVLGARLMQCVGILLALEGRTAAEIFGPLDELKLRSSMTLFAHVAPPASPFARVLEKYFARKPDERTLQSLANTDTSGREA